MSHLFETAASGRSKCRGCAQAIERGELRFGERLPSPFAEGEMTVWLHPHCAAYKRPEAFLQAAQRSPGAQAKCRSCREPIARASWRIRIVFYEEGRFVPGGFVHLDCRKAYFETDDVLDRLLHFSRDLSADEREQLTRACAAGPGEPPMPRPGE